MAGSHSSTHASSASLGWFHTVLGGRRNIGLTLLGLALVTVLVAKLISLIPQSSGAGTNTYPRQGDGVAVANCNGTIQTVRLSSGSAQLINPGGQCLFTFEVTKGTVRFGNNAGEVAEWSEGQAAGGRMRGVVTKAQAVTSVATLNYMLCPLNRQVVGWQCL